MHVAMFIMAWCVDTDNSGVTTIPQTYLDAENTAFQYLKWGHLITAILQITAMQLKLEGKHFSMKFC